jgi:hypothetical protein
LTSIGREKVGKEGQKMYDRSQFRRGLDVFDRDGNKLGDIADVGSDYLQLSTGFLGLGHHLYFPFSLIEQVDDRGVHLNAAKEEIAARDWTHPPAPETPAQTQPTQPEAGTTPAQPTAEATPAQPSAGAMPKQPAVGATPVQSAAVAAGAGRTHATPDEVRGHCLCDVNGNQIGNISSVGRDYFHVITGLLGLGENLYVPIDAVDHCDGTNCFLSISSDEARSRGWTTRPSAETFAGAAPRAAAAGQPMTPAEPAKEYRIPIQEVLTGETAPGGPVSEGNVESAPSSEKPTENVNPESGERRAEE